MKLFFLLCLTTLPMVLALPNPSEPASSPVPSNRVTAFPVCGTLGFTEEPGDNEIGPLEGQELTLDECLRKCRSNSTCNAVSYAHVYKLCSFYRKSMKHDQLDSDDTSFFAHYDRVCYF